MVTPGPEGAAPLRLSTHVDAAFLDRTQRELETVLHARMSAAFARRALAWRPRPMRHGTAFAEWRLLRVVGSRAWAVGLSLLSLAGLFFVLDAAAGAHLLASREADLALCVAGLAVAWFPHRRWAAWVDRYTARPPRSAIAGTMARIHARALLRQARKAAPFEAQYALDGSRAVYVRIGDERRDLVWERTLTGWRHSGEHFTLLFKTETAETPDCLLLHAPSAAFEAHLEAHGVRAAPPMSA
ncbi:hypothetical protein QPK31_15235 [Massilia sp. YIM B02769]|nr:hypothetical protein [Massilia sp. YIM B02769]